MSCLRGARVISVLLVSVMPTCNGVTRQDGLFFASVNVFMRSSNFNEGPRHPVSGQDAVECQQVPGNRTEEDQRGFVPYDDVLHEGAGCGGSCKDARGSHQDRLKHFFPHRNTFEEYFERLCRGDGDRGHLLQWRVWDFTLNEKCNQGLTSSRQRSKLLKALTSSTVRAMTVAWRLRFQRKFRDLAGWAMESARLLYQVRPKQHAFEHMRRGIYIGVYSPFQTRGSTTIYQRTHDGSLACWMRTWCAGCHGRTISFF